MTPVTAAADSTRPGPMTPPQPTGSPPEPTDLAGPDGAALLAAAAATLADGDPLTAANTLRRAGYPPDLAAAALTQARLRARGRAKFGPDADRMFFTRPGLEQATRDVVARRRAARLAAAGVTHLADLCCGVGADALAAARAGIRVTAVDADPVTARVARANTEALGLSGMIAVHHGRAEDFDLSDVDGVFADPARRRNGTRVFDPAAFSPPWDFVAALPDRVPRTALKLAPGIDHALIPAGVEAEWTSVGGEVVEAALWYGPLAGVPRRASVLTTDGSGEATLTGTGTAQAPVAPPRRYLYDPDGAVVRAHLVAEFADTVGGTLADPTIAYVYADRALPTPFARCLEITETMPFSVKRIRAALRARGIGTLTIRKRGSAVTPETLRRLVRLSGAGSATLVLTRIAGAPSALLCTEPPG